MKTNIALSLLSGVVITTITHFLKFGISDSEIGPYYYSGFPLKTIEMFGDAGVYSTVSLFGNFCIWSFSIFAILFVIQKNKKSQH